MPIEKEIDSDYEIVTGVISGKSFREISQVINESKDAAYQRYHELLVSGGFDEIASPYLEDRRKKCREEFKRIKGESLRRSYEKAEEAKKEGRLQLIALTEDQKKLLKPLNL